VVLWVDEHVRERPVYQGGTTLQFVEPDPAWAHYTDSGLVRAASAIYCPLVAQLFDFYLSVRASQIEALPYHSS